MSNIGKPLSKAERQDLIELMADEDGVLPEGLTQENIAAAIGASQASISADLQQMEDEGRIIRSDNSSRRGPKRKPKEPAWNSRYNSVLHGVINNLWDSSGKPTAREIIEAATQGGLIDPKTGVPLSTHTAERALSIVEATRPRPEPVFESEPEVEPEPKPEPQPTVLSVPCPTCGGTGIVRANSA